MIRSSLNYILLLLAIYSVGAAMTVKESARLRVRVLADNSPVVGATVSLSGSGIGRNARTGYQGYTNEAGEYEFSQLPEGVYVLRVSKLSFFSTSDGSIAESEIVLSDGETRVVQSYLTKGGVITGRLLNTDNEVLTGIPVAALSFDATTSQGYHLPARFESNSTSVSDDRGIFRIYGLRPGNYIVAINAQRDISLRKDILPLRYPGRVDSATSGGVFVGFSEEVKLPDLQLTSNLSEGCSIFGSIQGKWNLPLPEALVTLIGIDDQALSDKLLTNATGGFSFEDLAPGRYRLIVSSNQGPYRRFMKEVDLIQSQNRKLVISLSENPAVEGRTYLIQNEKPQSFPMIDITLNPVDGSEATNFKSGSDGKFSVRMARTGPFSWDLPGLARNQYLAYIESAHKEMTASYLLIGNKSISDIAIYVATGAAGIEGRFPETTQSGCEELQVYSVRLSPEDNTVLSWKRANTCIGRSFAIYSLPPGKYYLVALALDKSEGAGTRHQDHALRAALKESNITRQNTFTLDRNETASRQPVVPGQNVGPRP